MATLLEQRNLSMTPEQWAALEAIAAETNSRATRGRDAHQPTWRTFMRRIADREVIFVEREPYKMPAFLDNAIAANEELANPAKVKTRVKLEQLSLIPEPA